MDHDVIEDLGRRQLTEFACRWAIESGGLRDAVDAQHLVEGLDRFCVWVEENHDLPLHTAFAPVLTGLQESLPRVALANRACEPAVARDDLEWLELVERRGTSEAVVRDLEGRPRSVGLSPSILRHLRPGDWMRCRDAADEGLEVGACYPAALREALLT